MIGDYVKSAKTDAIIAVIHKCGSSTITSALHEYERLTIEESDAYPIRLGFIRNPIERFQSWWSFIRGLLDEGHRDTYPDGVTENYETFADYMLDNADKEAFAPYTTTHPNMTDIYPLTELEEVWPKYVGGARRPGRMNAWAPASDISEYRMDEIIDVYRKDLELWHSL